MSIAPFIMCGILNWFSPPSYPQLGLTHQIDLILDLILVCIWYNTLSIHFTIINSDILPWTVTFTIIDSDIYHRKQWHLSSSTVIFTIIDSDIYHRKQWHLSSSTVIFTIIDSDIYHHWQWYLPSLMVTFYHVHVLGAVVSHAVLDREGTYHVHRCSWLVSCACHRGQWLCTCRHPHQTPSHPGQRAHSGFHHTYSRWLVDSPCMAVWCGYGQSATNTKQRFSVFPAIFYIFIFYCFQSP